MRPLIGTTTERHTNRYGLQYFQSYAANAEAITRAGGLPVFIPLGMPDEVIRSIYERLDGVLLPGGGDIDPQNYDKPRHDLTIRVDPDRDRVEIQLAQWAVADDLPTLGICRGHQLLNVALGGTMIQDIGTDVATDIQHDTPQDLPFETIAHTVAIANDSQLSKAIGGTAVEVNSLHHQAVVEVGEDVRVVAHAPDGIIEGTEVPDKFFVMSVQWHPEFQIGHADSADRLFSAFVEAAKVRMAQQNLV